jgi:hypothetical protein
VHWKNVQLYAWGLALNLACLWLPGGVGDGGRVALGDDDNDNNNGDGGGGGGGGDVGLLVGFSPLVWWVVATNAATGLFAGYIFKYLSVMAHAFASAVATVCILTLSAVVFEMPLQPSFFAGAVVITSSVLAYNYYRDDAKSLR